MTDTTWKHIIGIAGGMGPYAHIEFETLLLEAAAKHVGREMRDQDFPQWILSSMPATPDRTLALKGEGPKPVKAILESIGRLSDADFVVIPCNTAHAYLDELRAESTIPILDIVTETVRAAAEQTKRIGLLATTGTLESRVFQRAAQRIDSEIQIITLYDVEFGENLQEDKVMAPIYGPLKNGERIGGGVKSGALQTDRRDEISLPLRQAVTALAEEGAELVILGCTEIPLAIGRTYSGDSPLLDPMAVAAKAAIQIAAAERPLPE